jgi:glycine/D-amino acid oxidase-like deaminating enzyme
LHSILKHNGAIMLSMGVVIAGAGIVGASIGYHLAKRGAAVTILERQRPGAGATQNSFAWLNSTFSKQPHRYFLLNLLGIAGWRRLQSEIGSDLEIQWGGSVNWGPAELRDQVRKHQEWGYGTQLIDEAELRKLLPNVLPGSFQAACWSREEGAVDPMQALRTILQRAQSFGAEVQYPCEVTGIDIAAGRVTGVQTTRGAIEAATLVLAAGVDTTRLAGFAEVHVPLQESPGVLAHTKPLPRLLDRIAMAPGANMKQNPDGRIVTASDFGGTPGSDASRAFGTRLLAAAAKYLPGLQGAELETMTLGYRVLPQDEYPIVGFTQKCPNLYIAAMHSGMTLSPLIGQYAATEILDGATVEMLSPYRPSRFA